MTAETRGNAPGPWIATTLKKLCSCRSRANQKRDMQKIHHDEGKCLAMKWPTSKCTCDPEEDKLRKRILCKDPEIQKMLVLSTAHLSPEEAQRLSADANGHPWPALDWEYGWIIYIRNHDNSAEEWPGLCAAAEVANRLDLTWIRFDEDGPALHDLPFWEW